MSRSVSVVAGLHNGRDTEPYGLGHNYVTCSTEIRLLITTFKCLQGNAPSYLSSNFLFSDSAHSKGTRSQTFKCLLLPPWKTNPGRRSFHFRAVNRWNKLSNDIRLNFSTMTTHIKKNAISTL